MTQSPDVDRTVKPMRMSRRTLPDATGTQTGQAWYIPAIAATVALILLALFWDRPITDDVAWYLMATRD